jgi:hypothetical protein
MNLATEDFLKYDEFIDQYDMYIWDFDYTILKIHSYASHIELKDVESASWKKLIGDFADPIFFRDLVYYLRGKKKEVAVVSFGTYNVIKAYLDRLFDDTHIFDSHNILTPLSGNQRHSSSFRINSDKNEHLVCLMRQNPTIKYDRAIFFDDTYQNIQGARELGMNGILINPKIGFTRKVWEELIKVETINISGGGNKNKEESCKILEQSLDDNEIESKKGTRRRQPRNDNISKNKPKNKHPCNDDYLIETFDGKKEKESGKGETKDIREDINEKEDVPVSSYFMNWLNILAVVFIFVYYLIKKYNPSQ